MIVKTKDATEKEETRAQLKNNTDNFMFILHFDY